jgi:hypothetical protein
MTASDEYGASYRRPVSGWVGWIIFAAVFMIVIGVMNAIQGLAALFRDESFFVVGEDQLLTFDWTSWGWIHLIFGILLVIVGGLLMQGSPFARVLGVALVSLNMIAQFGFLAAYPFWALIAIAIDVVILYALIVHGGELAT